MESSQVDALLAELLSSDSEDTDQPENLEDVLENPENLDLESGLFEDAELEEELNRLRKGMEASPSNDFKDGNPVEVLETEPESGSGNVETVTLRRQIGAGSEHVQVDIDNQISAASLLSSLAEDQFDESLSPPTSLGFSDPSLCDDDDDLPVIKPPVHRETSSQPASTTNEEGVKVPNPRLESEQTVFLPDKVLTVISSPFESQPHAATKTILHSTWSKEIQNEHAGLTHEKSQDGVMEARGTQEAHGSSLDTKSGKMAMLADSEVIYDAAKRTEAGDPEKVQNPMLKDVPKWKQDLLEAERATQLLAEGHENGSVTSVMERLRETLSTATQDWNPQGRPDAQGGMIGGAASIRVTNLSSGPLANTAKNNAKYGSTRVICNTFYRSTGSPGYWYTAVGTSQGYVCIEASTYTGVLRSHAPATDSFDLREGGAEVTALGFSNSGEKERLLLVAGQNTGALHVWDIASRRLIANISGCHSLQITNCCFLPNLQRAPSTIISTDLAGGLYYHALTSWVVRTGVSSRLIITEGRGPALLYPLMPFTIPLKAGNQPPDPPSALSREENIAVAGEGLVCICGIGLCEIGRFWGDGKFVRLYKLSAPEGASAQDVPIANWSPNFPGSRRVYREGGVPVAQLAVGWSGCIRLLEIPLLGDWVRAGDSASGEQGSRWSYKTTRIDPNERRALQKSAERLPINLMTVWNTDESSVSNSVPFPTPEFPIINLHWMAPAQLGALRKQGVLSQFLIFNSQLEVIEQVEIDDWPNSLRYSYGEQEFKWPYAASAGLVSKVTLIGSRSIKIIRLMGWEECLDILREIGKLKMSLHMGMQFFLQTTQKAGQFHSSGSAHLGAKDPALVARRLSVLLLEYLDAILGMAYSTESDRETALIEAARLSTDLCILLKMTKALFQDVFPKFVSCGCEAQFLQVLELAIVRNELSEGVAPEVIQALVEHCCETGNPDKVERCVLRMDIASLDLNQVIRLCLKHNLFVALLYVFSSALNDITTPALHLINAILKSDSEEEAEKYTMKVLVYIHCCLQQLKYPPGSGQLLEGHQQDREKIMGLLLFTKFKHLEDAKSFGEDSRRGSSTGDAQEASKSESLHEPYPVLRCLLTHKTESLVWMLRETLSQWDCSEKDVLEAWSGGQVEEMQSVRSLTQVLVDALIVLLKSDSLSDKSALVEYICDSVACGRSLVKPDEVIHLLEHLTRKALSHLDDKPGCEKLFCDIVRTIGVQKQYQTLNRSSALLLNYGQAQEALALANQANMLQATALLHHLSGNFRLALNAVLADCSKPDGPFEYITKSLQDLEDKPDSVAEMRKSIMGCMEDLVARNPEAAALMVVKSFPNDHQAVIQGLKGTRPLLFQYMRSAMQAALSKGVSETLIDFGDIKNVDLSRLLTREHCTTYVGLLCEFERDSVLPFLQIQDHMVDLDQCKELCRHFQIREGLAHLLEREGDIKGALQMYLQEVESSNDRMDTAVTSEGATLDFLNNERVSRRQSLGFLIQGQASQLKRRQSQYVKQIPDVFKNARNSLRASVAFCQRNSKQMGLGKDAREKRGLSPQENRGINEQEQMLDIWFTLLEVYVARIRKVSQQALQLYSKTAVSSLPKSVQQNMTVSCRLLHNLTHYDLRSTSSNSNYMANSPQLALLHEVYSVFMHEIVSAMADYVSLKDILEKIVVQHAHDHFGDFRGTLLGLMSAYKFEHNILDSVHQMVNSDAYRTLLSCYNEQRKSYKPQQIDHYHAPISDVSDDSQEESPAANLRVAENERGELVLSPGGVYVAIPISRGR